MLDRIREEPHFHGKGIFINKVYAAGILPRFFPVKTLISSVLSYPVSSALIGIGTREQAEAAMLQNASLPPLSPTLPPSPPPSFSQVISRLEKEFSPIPCDRCQRCKCPCGTEIHTLFRQYNYYFLGKDHWALRKLNMGISRSAELCRFCTDMPCLSMCPKKIRIPDEIERVLELVNTFFPVRG